MIYTQVSTHMLQQAMSKLQSLKYSDVNIIIDHFGYCLQNYTYEDDNNARNPVGFDITNIDDTNDDEYTD